jgi:hypothetical protein
MPKIGKNLKNNYRNTDVFVALTYVQNWVKLAKYECENMFFYNN